MPMWPVCGGIMPQVDEVGKQILAAPRGTVLRYFALLTAAGHPCSVRRYMLPRSATALMGRDPLASRATANPSVPLVTASIVIAALVAAERPIPRTASCCCLPAVSRIPRSCRYKLGEL